MQNPSSSYSNPLTTPPPPLSMKRSSSAPSEPQGWWIGLQLNLKKESLKNNHTNSNIPSIITATIHDYNTSTNESQIWIYNNNNNNIITDYINLNSNPPPWHNIIGNIYDNNNIFIPNNNEWIPMKLEKGSHVLIKHINNIELEGIIDSYDPISRRYHITYTNNKSEWLWCNNNNTKLNNNSDNKSNFSIQQTIVPPPFDTTPYGLNKSFIQFSRKMSNDSENRKRNIESPNINTQPPNKKRKINNALSDESPLIIRIPKMTEKVTKSIPKSIETTEKREIEIITISSESASPPKINKNINNNNNNNIIDLIDDDEEEIIVGTAQHREYNRQLVRREKERRRRRKKERRKSRRSKGSSKYPRKTRINDVKWKRRYAKEEKRYYWVQKNNTSKSSWNPFKDAGLLAPWLKGRSAWEKWHDAESNKHYFYNPINQKSTFTRPIDYHSPEEIDHDSMDDDYKSIRPIYNDPHNDEDIQVIGIAHPMDKLRHKKSKKNKNKTKQNKQNKQDKQNSRRYTYCDPNAGGFNFHDVPADKPAQKEIEDNDMSLLKAVSGLEEILTGNIKENSEDIKMTPKSTVSTGTADSNGSVDIEAIFGVDGDRGKAARYDTNEIVKACWKLLEPNVRNQPKIKFNELISTHAAGWNLDDDVINALLLEYNQTIVDIFQNSMEVEVKNKLNAPVDMDVNALGDSAKQRNVWAQLDENLRSLYKSQNVKAINFVLQVFDDSDESKHATEENKEKCLSILKQNSDNLVRILKSDRKGFIDDITRILLAVVCGSGIDDLDHNMEMQSKVDIDTVFGAFGYGFVDEYMYSLIKYGKENSKTIHMLMVLGNCCIVYQLIGCNRMMDILDRWNIIKLLNQRNIFSHNKMDQDDEDSDDEISPSVLLSIEVLKLINILTKGINCYNNITKLQKDCIEDIQQNPTNYMLRGFPLDVLYNALSGALKYNLFVAKKSNFLLFELCCNILKNIINVNEPIILKMLDANYKRSKRVIYLLHKTYTELKNDRKKRKKLTDSSSSDDSFYNNDSDEANSPRTRLRMVIQPYEFKNMDDASFEPYGIELDVRKREDPKQLSNIDCRESIGDILLQYIERISNNNNTYINNKQMNLRYKYLISTVFSEMLESSHLVRVSWGYNKALNHYHRDNICVQWIKNELLYQHSIDGREHPNKNNQPERHFRICSLIEILFDPLICDYKNYIILLKKLCDLCIEYKNKTNSNFSAWKKLQDNLNNNNSNTNNRENEENYCAESMNSYISHLYVDIRRNCNNIISNSLKNNSEPNKNDVMFIQLLSECVNDINNTNDDEKEEKKEENAKQKTIDVKALYENFEKVLRNKCAKILSSRTTNTYNMPKKNDLAISSLISLILRSNTLHLLVGLTQMEATSVAVRNCARRAIRCIVWSVQERHKLFLKKSQIPFLPTINLYYKTHCMPNNFIHTKDKDTLVVGDGNLSFGRALARLHGLPKTKQKLKIRKCKNNNNNLDIDFGARNTVVTCYESAMELLKRYPHSGSVVAEIIDRGGLVLYGVDATKLKLTLENSFRTYGGDKRPYKLFNDIMDFQMFKYDIIIWNFPHAMAGSYNPSINGDLVENFFISAKEILKVNGEIHVTLHINHQIDDEIGKKAGINKTYHQYLTWSIPQRAEQQQLRCVKQIELKHRLYPGYAIKNVQGNPFNIVKAQTYVFKRIKDIKEI